MRRDSWHKPFSDRLNWDGLYSVTDDSCNTIWLIGMSKQAQTKRRNL